MINIVLFGVGKLGSRHLQALSQVKIKNTNLHVVDPSIEAVKVAKERFDEMKSNSYISSVNYVHNINDLVVKKIDLAIIATTSEHRKPTINSLCLNFSVKYVLLEKFLFQDKNSYYEVEKQLNQHAIKTWVNCPRRQHDFYNDIKSQLSDKKLLQVDVSGPHWSLATSSIHFIDLIAFLTNEKSYEIQHTDFGDSYVPAYSIITGLRESKYIEFYGSIKGKFKDSAYFNFICHEIDNTPLVINLKTNKGDIIIFEEFNKCFFNLLGEDKLISNFEKSIVIPYQSELTNLIAEDIILKGESKLTSYKESKDLHLPLLESYLSFLSGIKNTEVKICPIT